MAVNLREFDGWLDEHDWPGIVCPVCFGGTVRFDGCTHHPDRASEEVLELHRQSLGPPDELSGTFHGTLTCDSSRCRQSLSMAGDWQLVFNNGDPSLGQFGNIYRVRYVNPPLMVMHLPDETPTKVRQVVESASVVLWLSPSSAANRLRCAVEELLSAKKVPKTHLDKKGKRHRLTLHARIEDFRASHPEVADALEAVKWIGNDGAHDDTLNVQDVLMGAEILEVAIRALYDRSEALLRAKVRAINKAKGLRGRRA